MELNRKEVFEKYARAFSRKATPEEKLERAKLEVENPDLYKEIYRIIQLEKNRLTRSKYYHTKEKIICGYKDKSKSSDEEYIILELN